MATFTIGEAMSRIPKLLDKAAAEAKRYMVSYINEHADRGYATGELAGSIYVEKRGDSARAVGSAVKHAKYVNKGRGPVKAKNPSGRLHYYDPVVGAWMHPKEVGPMSGINFIEATKTHLENTYFSL